MRLKDVRNGVLVFVLGMNGLGLGMISNGANRSDNPVWPLFQGFFDIEEAVCVLLILILLVVGIIVIGGEIEADKHRKQIEDEAKTSRDAVRQIAWIDVDRSEFVHKPKAAAAEKPAKPVLIRDPVVHVEKRSASPKPEPTAEELKESAIQQIIGGY